MPGAPVNPRQLPAAALAIAIADAAGTGDHPRLADLAEEVRYRSGEPTAAALSVGRGASVTRLIAALRTRVLSDRARWDELAAELGERPNEGGREERCYGRVAQCDDLLRYLAEVEEGVSL